MQLRGNEDPTRYSHNIIDNKWNNSKKTAIPHDLRKLSIFSWIDALGSFFGDHFTTKPNAK